MKRIFFLLVLLLSARSALAADAAYTLMVPSAPVVAGTEVRVDLAAINPGALEAPFGAPLSIAGKVIVNGEERDVTLDSVTKAPVAVSPGGFAARRYRLTLPRDLSGRVVLELDSSGFGVLRGVLDVQAAPVAQGPAAAAYRPRIFLRLPARMAVFASADRRDTSSCSSG